MEKEYVEAIQCLVKQYYGNDINVGEYRSKRKQIVDLMDDEFNGAVNAESKVKSAQVDSIENGK